MSNDFDAGFPNNYSGQGYNSAGENPKRDKKEKKTTKKVVGLNKKLALVFAAVAAIFAMFITTSQGSTEYVARVINPVSSFESVSFSNVEVVKVSKNSVEPGSISGASAEKVKVETTKLIKDNRTNTNLYAGQQLRSSFFSARIQPSTPLMADERLISIGARPSSSVVGTIKAGDKVDIYASVSGGVAGLVATNIEVVSVSISSDQLDNVSQQQLSDKSKKLSELVPSYPVPGTYVLRVKVKDVNKFIAVDSGAKVYLVLRGIDAVDSAQSVIDPIGAICSTEQALSTTCQKNLK